MKFKSPYFRFDCEISHTLSKHSFETCKTNNALLLLIFFTANRCYFSAMEQLGSQQLNLKLRSKRMSITQYEILPSKVLFLASSASSTSGLWGGGGLWRWYSSPGGAGGAPWCTAAHISAAPHHPEYPSILSLEVSWGILRQCPGTFKVSIDSHGLPCYLCTVAWFVQALNV